MRALPPGGRPLADTEGIRVALRDMGHAARLVMSLSLLGIAAVTGTTAAQERQAAVSGRAGEGVASRVRRGRAACEAGRWTEAEAAFHAALAAPGSGAMTENQRAEVAGELGLCELSQKKYRDAAEHLEQSLTPRATLGPLQVRRFQEGQARAERYVERLYLAVNPPDAEVWLDGRPIGPRGRSDLLFLEPGPHTLRARLAGHGETWQALEAVAGMDRSLGLTVVPRPEPGPALAPMARTPPRRAPPPAAPVASPSSAVPALRTAGIALTATAAVVGGGALIGAAVIDAGLEERRSELGWSRDACFRPSVAAACEELHDALERRVALRGVGAVSLAASGALGLATLASFVLAPSEPPPGRRALRVGVLFDQQAGVTIGGVW